MLAVVEGYFGFKITWRVFFPSAFYFIWTISEPIIVNLLCSNAWLSFETETLFLFVSFLVIKRGNYIWEILTFRLLLQGKMWIEDKTISLRFGLNSPGSHVSLLSSSLSSTRKARSRVDSSVLFAHTLASHSSVPPEKENEDGWTSSIPRIENTFISEVQSDSGPTGHLHIANSFSSLGSRFSLELKRKISGQAKCKPQQLPGGLVWRREGENSHEVWNKPRGGSAHGGRQLYGEEQSFRE